MENINKLRVENDRLMLFLGLRVIAQTLERNVDNAIDGNDSTSHLLNVAESAVRILENLKLLGIVSKVSVEIRR